MHAPAEMPAELIGSRRGAIASLPEGHRRNQRHPFHVGHQPRLAGERAPAELLLNATAKLVKIRLVRQCANPTPTGDSAATIPSRYNSIRFRVSRPPFSQ